MSSLISCVVCKGNVSSNASVCPHCGEPDFNVDIARSELVKLIEFRRNATSLLTRLALRVVDSPQSSGVNVMLKQIKEVLDDLRQTKLVLPITGDEYLRTVVRIYSNFLMNQDDPYFRFDAFDALLPAIDQLKREVESAIDDRVGKLEKVTVPKRTRVEVLDYELQRFEQRRVLTRLEEWSREKCCQVLGKRLEPLSLSPSGTLSRPTETVEKENELPRSKLRSIAESAA